MIYQRVGDGLLLKGRVILYRFLSRKESSRNGSSEMRQAEERSSVPEVIRFEAKKISSSSLVRGPSIMYVSKICWIWT